MTTTQTTMRLHPLSRKRSIRAIHITDLDGKPQAPLNVEATAPIRSFDWVDPARAVRAAGKVATTFGELKAGGGSR